MLTGENMNPEQFVQELSKHNITLTADQKEQFKLYFKELVAANEHVNLTRITAEDEVYLKHFYDSITPLLVFPEAFKPGAKVCDVGAGAGFPSLPLKLLRPDLQLTIIDSLGKRLTFLQGLIKQLGLTGVELVHSRAEDAGKAGQYREQFDLVTARAVARMSVLSEYCLPLVKVGGQFLALKGPKASEELKAAQGAIKKLGGQISQEVEFKLAASAEERSLILVDKLVATPQKYPRQAGTPAKKPLK